MVISGKCHCGNISFVLRWEPEPSEIPARACTCSFCTKHGGVWTSCPTGSLEVNVGEPSCVAFLVAFEVFDHHLATTRQCFVAHENPT